LHPYESPRPGTVIFVGSSRGHAPVVERHVVVVPEKRFFYPKHRRVFYEVVLGDKLGDIAKVCGVAPDDLRRWNALQAGARLQNGMELQMFIPKDASPPGVALLEERDVQILTVGTAAFYRHFLDRQGRERRVIKVRKGDTWRKLSKRHGVRLRSMERTNHRSFRGKLRVGERVVVYAKKRARSAQKATTSGSSSQGPAASPHR
jgi:LysM repeat protein